MKVLLLVCLLFPLLSYAADDPTQPLNWSASKRTVEAQVSVLPSLKSIICMSQCSAVIHDQVVTEGDVIDGYTIKEIRSSGVTVQRNNKKWQLKLYSLEIKH